MPDRIVSVFHDNLITEMFQSLRHVAPIFSLPRTSPSCTLGFIRFEFIDNPEIDRRMRFQ
jgi:hypothetical protein